MRHFLSLQVAKLRSSAPFQSVRLWTQSARPVRNLCLAVLAGAVSLSSALAQVPVVPTSRGDNARSGANTNETLLTPVNVNKNSFGHLFSVPIDPHPQFNYATTILAQPLYMPSVNIAGQGTHNVVYVATLADSVYAIDADNGTVLWTASMLNGGTTAFGTNLPCGFGGYKQEGIVSTPVIDPGTNTMYLVAKTVLNGSVRHELHALDITSGADEPGSPVEINAQSTSNLGHVTVFNNLHQKLRPGLLLVNGVLYLGFGSNGCNDSNSGWVLSYNESTLAQVGVFNTSPDQGLTSIWQSGSGLAADEAGNIYAETGEAGNNAFDVQNGGQTYCDSVIKLAPDDTLADFFTPNLVPYLNSNDFDLSSTGAVVLPDQDGPYPHELIAGGKYGTLYVLNRDSMGGYSTTSDQIVQEVTLVTQNPDALKDVLFGSPAYWNGTVYSAPDASPVRAFPMSGGQLGTQIKTKQNYTGSHSPSVSANGNTNGILWVLSGGLNAFNACTGVGTNACQTGQTPLELLYTSNQAAGARDKLPVIGHFITQTVAGGKVYVATQTSLEAYGLFESVMVTAGNNQTGTVGMPLPAPIQIQATNPYTGQVDSGTTVTFSSNCKPVGAACGSFNPTSAVTDANGYASTTFTLPQKAGVYTVTFAGVGFSNATASATAESAIFATKLIAYGGGGQTGSDGSVLAKPIIAQLQDSFKNPVPGVTVTFTATKSGIPNPASVVTDATGMARSYLQLPGTPSAVTVTANAPGPNNTILKGTYAEHSVAPITSKITVTSGNNQSSAAGNQLSAVLTVLVADQFGSPISGNSVTFTDNGAGGTFSAGTTVVTGADGTASESYTLPKAASAITIDATATGLSTPAVFAETAVAGPAANLGITGGNNQSAPAGSQLPQALTVSVTDQYGNAVSGVSVTFSDGGSGGIFSNPNPGVTGSNGTLSQFYTLPPVGGEVINITATAAGVTNPVSFTENGQ
jgi:hypothetical protein